MQIIPLCRITGLPSRRRIQPISARLISGLWRICFGIETEGQLGGIAHFELWESPCGLAFFEPMLSGNEGFYRDLYRQLDLHRRLTTPGLARTEFQIIAKLVRPGQKILDVGCGEGGLAQCLANVSYVGLDLHFSPVAGGPNVRNETVAEHAVSQPAEYDLVCALHVIEHIADPLAFARDLVRCVRPGGRVCIAVPDRASLVTAIPNFVFNAPPHHLSWWDEGALRALAQRLGLAIEAIETVPFCAHDSIVYWMGRSAPKLTGQRYFRAHWLWHGALVWSWLIGRICAALFRVPASAEPAGLLLLARKL
jgi:SAM-dependent methyltransferase